MEIRLIVNPQAGAGTAGKKAAEVGRLLTARGVRFELAETTHPKHATNLAYNAAREGVSVLTVVGGDGTLNEVAQAYIDSEGKPAPGPDLALIPAGTGGDFCRSFNLDRPLPELVERLLAAKAQPHDLGIARIGSDVTAPRRAFVNIASFGISGAVAKLTNEGASKWLGGKAAFYLATTRATLGYRNAPVRLYVDGERWFEGRIYTVAFANGRYFGGGMKIAPQADPTDGLLDCMLIGDVSRLEAVANTPRVYVGKHLEMEKARSIRGRHFRAEPWITDDGVRVETDGETHGVLPLEVEVLPGAVRLRV